MDGPADRLTELLAELLDRLRAAGIGGDPERIADALWLARHARPPQQPEPGPRQPPPRGAAAGPGPGQSAPAAAPGRREPSPPLPDEGSLSLVPMTAEPEGPTGPDRPPGQTGGSGGRSDLGSFGDGPPIRPVVRAPAAEALADPLAVLRALRPLRDFVPARPRLTWELDPEATAEATAETDVLTLVRRRRRHRDASLHLLMDTAPSMVVWQRLLGDLRDLCEHLGAFREVRIDYLHRGEDGELLVSADPDPRGGRRTRLGLPDPSGRRIGLLLSDCTSSLWRGGRVQQQLREWGRRAPVAVLQPLPQRLWARTAFPAEACLLWPDARAEGGLGCRPAGGGRRAPRPAGAFPVPVLEPTAEALGGWARLHGGSGSAPVRAAVGWVWDEELPAPAEDRPPELSAEELVARFRLTASPDAVQLAVHLAAAPLTVPVMQLVQRALLPRSGPAELAEVLLSGLVVRRSVSDPWHGEQWYTYVPGVRTILLGPLAREEAVLVLKHCSDYVLRRFGSSARNFPALAVAQLEGTVAAEGAEPAQGPPRGFADRMPQSFAEVPALVVRRYLTTTAGRRTPVAGAEPLEAARSLVQQFQQDGLVRRLLDSAQILARLRATQDQSGGGGATAAVELAEVQYLLWQVQGDSGMLRQARATAQAAVEQAAVAAESGSTFERLQELARARRCFGQALHSSAHELLAAGQVDRATLELELAAGQLLGAFGQGWTLRGLGQGVDLELVLERAEVLRELWVLSGEGATLREAAGLLEALVTETRLTGAGYVRHRLLLGRILLDLVPLVAASAAVTLAKPPEELREALLRLREGLLVAAADGGVTGARRAAALLDLARAVRMAAGRPPTDPARDEVLQLLRQARVLSGSDPALTARCWEQRAGRLVERRDAGLEREALAAAAEAYDEARRQYPQEHREHARLLAERGRILLRLAVEERQPRLATEAVLVLREALAETPREAPDSAERRLLVGRALSVRHDLSQDLADLREAEYLTERAAAGPWPEPEREVAAWLDLGDLRIELHRSTGARRWLNQALEAYRLAVRGARTLGGTRGFRLAARASHRRGRTWEALDRPLAARDEYREALREWQRLDDGGGTEAEQTRQAAERLSR